VYKKKDCNRTCAARKPDETQCVVSSGKMNCLTFNCWGEGNKPIVRELATISQVLSHRLLFICETRQNKNNMCSLRRRLGLKGFAGFSSYGLSGASSIILA
jgi:hypothetical protein